MYSWIRDERTKRGLSQSKLSKLTGITQAYLSAWEHKKSMPNRHQQQIIIDAFKKYDEMLLNGDSKDFLKKTRWSKAYKNSYRINGGRRKISADEISAFISAQKGRVNLGAEEKLEFQNKYSDFCGISLFSGCGGMALGFSQAGVKIVGHTEIDEAARKIFKNNFPESIEIGENIKKVDDDKINEFKNQLPKINIIFGGPPCQGFSLTGKRNIYDPRNQLYNDFARFVNILQPDIIVLENVRLLTTMKTHAGNLLIEDLLATFRNIGYRIDWKVLNAQNFGVPQFRERIFLIGLHNEMFKNKSITFPKMSHVNNGLSDIDAQLALFSDELQSILTLRDAIGDLEFLESGEISQTDPLHFAVSHPTHVIEMLKDVPEGCSAHENSNPSLRPKSGYNTTYKRLKWGEPASTISTTFGMISGSRNVHPEATRSLTIREAMRCQTFPDDFLIYGKLGDIRTMIGNAVPPKLAYAIARHLLDKLIC